VCVFRSSYEFFYPSLGGDRPPRPQWIRHWFRLQNTFHRSACLYMRVRTLLHHYIPHRTLCSGSQHLLQQPRVYTELDKRPFSYLAPKRWNSLSLEIRLSRLSQLKPSSAAFKLTYSVQRRLSRLPTYSDCLINGF